MLANRMPALALQPCAVSLKETFRVEELPANHRVSSRSKALQLSRIQRLQLARHAAELNLLESHVEVAEFLVADVAAHSAVVRRMQGRSVRMKAVTLVMGNVCVVVDQAGRRDARTEISRYPCMRSISMALEWLIWRDVAFEMGGCL